MDAGLLTGRHYYFVYRTSVPPGLSHSLYNARPYIAHGDYYMRLDQDWYATVYEDD